LKAGAVHVVGFDRAARRLEQAVARSAGLQSKSAVPPDTTDATPDPPHPNPKEPSDMPIPLVQAGLAALLTAAAPAGSNPLLAPWSGPYGGVPPFDRVKIEHFEPALEAAMADQLAAIDRITAETAPATFGNTIAALERSDRVLKQASSVYDVWGSTMNTPEFQAVETRMEPKLAAFRDRITQNAKLFERIAAVYDARERSGLTPEQKRLAWLYYTDFVRAGAKLGPEAKKRVSEVNQRLAALFTKFGQNILADENDYVLFLEKEADLAGLPAAFRSAAAAAAQERGRKGQWAVLNTRSSVEPFLAYSDRRELRERVWRTFVSRGDNGDAKDTKAIVTEILALRAERARLLGYETHAHWRLENTMAKTPERVMALLEAVWTPAVARVREEVADMQAIADREGAGIRIAPWDYRYYAEKVRKAKYDLDENAVVPYLQLEQIREGMFWVAAKVFGLHFAPAQGVPVYHPDVAVFEVKDDGRKLVGLWYFDPWARPYKRSGAWMNAYRDQERFDGEITTIVSNNANFVKGGAGQPVLISWDDATTMFHEFGHALHGLSSNVAYPSLSGTSVARDFVELPSQILEHWLATPEVLTRFATHFQTGQPIPPELVARIERSETFNQGFETVEYVASALVDMKLHLAGATPIDPDAFERDTLKALGMPEEIVMRHRTPQFSHIFAGDGYSAGYYSYLWSDVLTADAWEAFTGAGGPYDPALAKRLRDHVFSVGTTVDPADAYRAFRGHDASIDALMRKRGFPVPPKAD
jgi:peptidyl-dipeptidase Dcp